MDEVTQIWTMVIRETAINQFSKHGPEHWVRVERNGLYIAEQVGADKVVISLFAVFHDCMRVNESLDPQHGLRGAKFANSIRKQLPLHSDEQFEKLYYACQWHTDKIFTDDVTLGACWDADRLDLKRVGITPDAKFLNSSIAKEIANNNLYSVIDKRNLRTFLADQNHL